MPVKEKVRRKRSERGNWLVVTYLDDRIRFCTWVRTWAGVAASRRETDLKAVWWEKRGSKIRVVVIDIDRAVENGEVIGAIAPSMPSFKTTEIRDLERLMEKEKK